MSHTFYCPKCNKLVADCGMADEHEQPFSFSKTCSCGEPVSGSCGSKHTFDPSNVILNAFSINSVI
ncbi:hypothetical protein [Anaeromicropila populeti]|uniref:hypothetical protein n=1 Tax=Anaeromicropila populeti TaxID=37658 RepID=UPI001160CCD4|nr:hypothetical protein [Anaeromicropila populeti]